MRVIYLDLCRDFSFLWVRTDGLAEATLLEFLLTVNDNLLIYVDLFLFKNHGACCAGSKYKIVV